MQLPVFIWTTCLKLSYLWFVFPYQFCCFSVFWDHLAIVPCVLHSSKSFFRLLKTHFTGSGWGILSRTTRGTKLSCKLIIASYSESSWLTSMFIAIFLMVQFFVKTGECKFGSKCKFNHPKKKDNGTVVGPGDKVSYFHLLTGAIIILNLNVGFVLWLQESLFSGNSTLPVKPSEPCPVRGYPPSLFC